MTINGIANTPSRFHSAGRQGKIGEDGCLVGGGGIVPCVSNKTVISIIMYVDRVLDFLWLCCGYWTRLVILWMSMRGGVGGGVGGGGPDTFDDSFTSTTCLYLSPSQLCLIKRESNFKVSQLNAGHPYSTFS